MQAPTLVIVSAAILVALGAGHILLTYFSSAFHPRQTALMEALTTDHPVITTQTTLWRGLTGFHVSHSMGAVYLGLMYGYLALEAPELLFRSYFLSGLGAGALVLYVILAKVYWFVVPLVGFCIALAFFLAALVMA